MLPEPEPVAETEAGAARKPPFLGMEEEEEEEEEEKEGVVGGRWLVRVCPRLKACRDPSPHTPQHTHTHTHTDTHARLQDTAEMTAGYCTETSA